MLKLCCYILHTLTVKTKEKYSLHVIDVCSSSEIELREYNYVLKMKSILNLKCSYMRTNKRI